MKIKCLVVDDEHLARTLLINYIEKINYLQLIDTCKNPTEAADILFEQEVDLMFLDIMMPEMTGIDFLKINQNNPLIILTTAYPDYALEGYQLNVIDYLLKPFSFDRFLQAVNKAADLLKLKKDATGNQTVDVKKDFLIVKTNQKIRRIHYADIIYIEGLKEYVSIFTNEHRFVMLRSLKTLQEELPDLDFWRIHKSYIVSKRCIKSIYQNQVDIGNDKKLPIGRSYKEDVISKYTGENED